MPIPAADKAKFGHHLRAWVALGHDPGNAALIANVLGAAGTITDVAKHLRDTETCAPPRGFNVVNLGGSEFCLMDGCNTIVLRFSMTEHRNPGYSEVRIL